MSVSGRNCTVRPHGGPLFKDGEYAAKINPSVAMKRALSWAPSGRRTQTNTRHAVIWPCYIYECESNPLFCHALARALGEICLRSAYLNSIWNRAFHLAKCLTSCAARYNMIN